MTRRSVVARTLGAAAVLAAFSFGGEAHAESPVSPTGPSPTGKGIVGGVLLGAEVPMITMGIIGVEEWWAYLLGGGLGAVGGGVGGYFVEDTGEAEPALYMLAGGMALVIPALVLTLNATSYKPGDDDEEGEIPSDEEPAADPAGATSVRVEASMRPRAGALIGLNEAGVSLGVPTVAVVPRYDTQEMAMFGVKQTNEVRFPAVSVQF